MGSERASVMMRTLPPVGWGEVATKRDLDEIRRTLEELRRELTQQASRHELHELELSIDAKFDRFKADLLRTFGTWLFASQAAVIAAVTMIVALVR